VVRNTKVDVTSPPGGSVADVYAALGLLADIVDTVREPLLVLDADFRVTHANRSFFTTFQVTPEDTIGEVIFALGNGQWDIPPLHTLLHDALPLEAQLDNYDVDHVFPGIGRKVMLLNARLIAPGASNPRMILLAIEDVTEQRRTERQVAAQRRELQRSNAALEAFAAIASHDLQEPLRKILSFGDRLNATAGPALDAEAHGYLDRMLNAAARMRILITDLLAYARVTTRAEPFVRVDLARLAHDVIADLETSIAEAGAVVDVGDLPTIDADPLQMRQLLQNLLGTAGPRPHWPYASMAAPPRGASMCSPSRTTASALTRSTPSASSACSNDSTAGLNMMDPVLDSPSAAASRNTMGAQPRLSPPQARERCLPSSCP
jgi:signal transduction histidine kinase